jgi:hypothetical protein
MDEKSFVTEALDKLEARLNEVPINRTFLEGVLAGVQLCRSLEFGEGYSLDRAIAVYQLYGQVLQASSLCSGETKQ